MKYPLVARVQKLEDLLLGSGLLGQTNNTVGSFKFVV